MKQFSIYSSVGKGIYYVDDMIDTIKTHIPILLESWENLSPYTQNNRWKSNLERNLELIGTGHYTLLKSLNYIRLNKDSVQMNDPVQRFKNTYFHFGLIIDCIRQISRSILLFRTKLGISQFQEEKLSLDTILAITEVWYNDNYRSEYDKLVSDGISIMIPLQPKEEFISQLASKKELKRYNSFRNNIQPYRNIYIHNPAVDIFYRKDFKKVFVVKKDKLKKYRFLNEIDFINIDDLVDPKIMINQDYSECILVLSDIWTIFVRHIKEINLHPNFIMSCQRENQV